MGLKQDLIIGGVIIAGIVIFKDKIASGLSSAGGALGEGIGGLGTSFFDALRGAIPETQTIETPSGTITAPSNLPVEQTQLGDVTLTEVGGGGFASASGGTLQEQSAALDTVEPTAGQGSFFNKLQSVFAGLLGPISGPTLAFAEESQFQGPQAPLDPDRPLDLTDFAAKLGITPAEAFKLQKNNPDLVEEISGSIFDPVSQKSFEQGGQGSGISGGFTIESNKPLTDIINQFKQLGFNISASQAANIKARLQEDQQVKDFDFGTNTGRALEIVESGASFGSGTREIELQKAIEAFRAANDPVFGGTSNFANPDFPITLGEAFLGKKGKVVSDSIANLNDEQLEQFIDQFGEA